jgi:hypothetical protein
VVVVRIPVTEPVGHQKINEVRGIYAAGIG